jgi:hypothetical protein
VALARRIGDKAVLSEGLRELGSLYYIEGDFTVAVSLTEEALAEARAIGSLLTVFLAFFQLVVISCLQNDPTKAKGYCLELWALGKDTGSPFAAAFALLSFGLAASVGGEPGKGARLLAAAQELLARLGVDPGEGDAVTKVMRQALAKAQAQLGPEGFEAAEQAGRALTLEQAIALAIDNIREDVQPPKA